MEQMFSMSPDERDLPNSLSGEFRDRKCSRARAEQASCRALRVTGVYNANSDSWRLKMSIIEMQTPSE
jgi:hypothetical protein